ncbi:alpha/beta fold hydrolase [Stackebrandtia albiflava]|uniref:alpha/beta fold hydrolase n=1 Tax=Stackebrandtia albiflava TaxID=406432 RepID=UPI0011BF7C69|nr:alpha/beta hydrolase [Stackebrandtia albiflava]
MREITVPTHLLLGGRSRLYDSHALAARADRLLPDLTTYVEPDGGHGFGYDDPESLATRVLTFIDHHDPRP